MVSVGENKFSCTPQQVAESSVATATIERHKLQNNKLQEEMNKV